MFLKTNKAVNTSHINVKLKPILGIDPKAYVLIGFYLLVALLFVSIAILPGALNYGSKIKVASNISGASVYVGDVRLGFTPLKNSFVKAGKNQTFIIKKEGFKDFTITINVDGSYFLSLIFPSRKTIKANLEINDINIILNNSFKEASSWVLREESRSFHRNDVIFQTAKTIKEVWLKLTDEEKGAVREWATQIPALIHDDSSLTEILDSWFILKELIEDLDSMIINRFLADKKTTEYALLSSLTHSYTKIDEQVISKRDARSPIEIEGIIFNYSSESHFLMGDIDNYSSMGDFEYFPHKVAVKGFYYMINTVSEAQLANFIQKTGYKELGDTYDRSRLFNKPAKNVDYYTAVAYAKYLDQKLNHNDLEVRLINEAEWDLLNTQNLINVDGYEWMVDPYLVLRNVWFKELAYLPITLPSSVYTVRGSDSSIAYGMSVNQRGSQEASIRSPHLGFRLVIGPK